MTHTLWECRYSGCEKQTAPRSYYCSEHRYPEQREDGTCLTTSCRRPAFDNLPWCEPHLREYEERDELRRLRAVVARAAFVAEHLMQMIDPQTWRDTGGDDGQGHYEGDYRAEQTAVEIELWREEIGG